MSTFVEYVTYRPNDGVSEEKLMELRRQAILDVKAAHPDLLSVPCVARKEDGSYLDIWVYASKEAGDSANAGAGEIPGFVAFFGAITDVEILGGFMPHSAESPL